MGGDQPASGSRLVVYSVDEQPERGVLLKRLFVTPDFEGKRSDLRLCQIHHDPGAMPAALLVEARGSFVSDGTREPRRLDAVVGEARLCVGHQRGGNARASRLCFDEQLIELVALDDAEADGGARWPHNLDVGKRGLKPVSKAR